MIEYKLIRTARKTVAICVKPDGEVEVRAPRKASRQFIEDFVDRKKEWIEQNVQTMRQRKESRRRVVLTKEQKAAAKAKAEAVISARCQYFAPRMGVDFAGVRVNSAKSRWGSCTAGGNLNFTYRLIYTNPELIDYVVVHELAHRKEMNHSSRFWAVVEGELPDYRQRRDKLREFQRQYEIVEEGE